MSEIRERIIEVIKGQLDAWKRERTRATEEQAKLQRQLNEISTRIDDLNQMIAEAETEFADATARAAVRR